MKATTLLSQQHDLIGALLRTLESERHVAPTLLRMATDELRTMLTVTERVFYPQIRARLSDRVPAIANAAKKDLQMAMANAESLGARLAAHELLDRFADYLREDEKIMALAEKEVDEVSLERLGRECEKMARELLADAAREDLASGEHESGD